MQFFFSFSSITYQRRSSDDHSPSGFERNNYYERGSVNSNIVRSSVGGGSVGPNLVISGGGAGSGNELETSTTSYIRRPNNYHGGGGVDLKSRGGGVRDRLYRNGPYSSSIVDR